MYDVVRVRVFMCVAYVRMSLWYFVFIACCANALCSLTSQRTNNNVQLCNMYYISIILTHILSFNTWRRALTLYSCDCVCVCVNACPCTRHKQFCFSSADSRAPNRATKQPTSRRLAPHIRRYMVCASTATVDL